jgi:chemotaxis signal transduction protein
VKQKAGGYFEQMVSFQWQQGRYAVPSRELLGIATGCPFTQYPGLPEPACGIVQWGGKIFPILDLSRWLGAHALSPHYMSEATYIFLKLPEELNDQKETAWLGEYAFAVPHDVRVFFPHSIEVGTADKKQLSIASDIAIDSDQSKVTVLNLKQLLLSIIHTGKKTHAA